MTPNAEKSIEEAMEAAFQQAASAVGVADYLSVTLNITKGFAGKTAPDWYVNFYRDYRSTVGSGRGSTLQEAIDGAVDSHRALAAKLEADAAAMLAKAEEIRKEVA
jgi:hypothetical protein